MKLLYFKHIASQRWLILGLIGLIGMGCSEKKSDNWYEESQDQSAEEEQYIQDQISFGSTEEKTRGDYYMQLFRLRTEGRGEKITVEGDELKQQISHP